MKDIIYTSVDNYKDKIFVRGYNKKNGERYNSVVKYQPYLFVEDKNSNKYQFVTIKDIPVKKLSFNNIWEARNFVKEYKEVENYSIHGMQRYEYVYIHDNFPKIIEHNTEYLRKGIVDIECGQTESDDAGFPEPSKADQEITVITLTCKVQGKMNIYCAGNKPLKKDIPNVHYKYCSTEEELLTYFVNLWKRLDLDIISGFNINNFDIIYLVNRIAIILDESWVYKLSPFGKVEEKEQTIQGRTNKIYKIFGVVSLDYYDLYRKFVAVTDPLPNYRLDTICNHQLGERKIDYSEYVSLKELYQKDYDKFVSYNIRDCTLIDKLDDKLQLIDLVQSMAYFAKCNYTDVFGPVGSWDIMLYHYLSEQNIVIPPKKQFNSTEMIPGGFVKEPKPGLYKDVVGLDVQSLYPTIAIIQGLSFNTFVKTIKINDEDTVNLTVDPEIIKYVKENNYVLSASGAIFRKDKEGFISKFMKELLDKRIEVKREMARHEKKLETETDETIRKELEYKKKKCDTLQGSLKIYLNSGYGALLNPGFRYFDPRLGTSITKTGQSMSKFLHKRVNEYINKVAKKPNDFNWITAGDTDSLFFSLKEIIDLAFPIRPKNYSVVCDYIDKLYNKGLGPYIAKCLEEYQEYFNCHKVPIVIKRETISNKAIWTVKKRYILNIYDKEGIRYETPKVKYVGIEVVRSSVPPICRELMKKAISLILNKTNNELIDFVQQNRADFGNNQFDDVSFPRGVNGIVKYSDKNTLYKKGTPIHVRASLVYNKMLQEKKLDKKFPLIHDSDKIKFSYLKMPNPFHENVIACAYMMPKEIDIESYIDYNENFERGFVKPIKAITDAIGWHVENNYSLDHIFTYVEESNNSKFIDQEYDYEETEEEFNIEEQYEDG